MRYLLLVGRDHFPTGSDDIWAKDDDPLELIQAIPRMMKMLAESGEYDDECLPFKMWIEIYDLDEMKIHSTGSLTFCGETLETVIEYEEE